MKVFFAFSPRAIKTQKNEFERVANWLEKQGHTQLNTIHAQTDVEDFYQTDADGVDKMYRQLCAKIKRADAIIVDTTIHSLTMGFYIKMALDLDKPTIILHKPGSKPFFFAGIKQSKLLIEEYTDHNLEQVLESALDFAQTEKEIRFNMFLTSDLSNYLDWAAKKVGMQRSHYIRQLLLADKEQKQEEYEAGL